MASEQDDYEPKVTSLAALQKVLKSERIPPEELAEVVNENIRLHGSDNDYDRFLKALRTETGHSAVVNISKTTATITSNKFRKP